MLFIKLEEKARQGRRNFLKEIGMPETAIAHLESRRGRLYSTECAARRIQELKERGFVDPMALIRKFPCVLTLSIENIDAKIQGLRERGFHEPVKIVAKLPAILGLSFENIDHKVEGLRQRGFHNAVELVSSYPLIFGLGFENLDRKLRYARRLKRCGIALDVVALIQRMPLILGNKMERIRFITRVIFELEDGDPKMFAQLMAKDPLSIAASTIGAKRLKDLHRNKRARISAKENARLVMESRTKVSLAFRRYKSA